MKDQKEEKQVFKPKMRITTLDEKGWPTSDRLVDIASELYLGPKIQHQGPIKLEIVLQSKQDIEAFKHYIDQLSGNLPLKESSNRGRPASGSTSTQIQTPREDIYAHVQEMVNEGQNQDAVIEYLRNLGFVFLLTEDFLYHFPEFEFNTKDVGSPTDNKQYLNSISWLVRSIKKAKDPKADKFDPMIIFGFSIINGPTKKVVPYLYKERKKPLRIPTGKKVLSFSTAEFTKFPKYQMEDERLKWSTEMRQLLDNPDKKPSKFFIRWAPDVLLPDKTYNALKRLNIRFKNDRSKAE